MNPRRYPDAPLTISDIELSTYSSIKFKIGLSPQINQTNALAMRLVGGRAGFVDSDYPAAARWMGAVLIEFPYWLYRIDGHRSANRLVAE